MRLLPWRSVQPQDPAADKAKLQDRLAKLTKPPVQDAVPASSVTAQPLAASAPISLARAKLQELTGAAPTAQTPAPIEPERTETTPAVQPAAPVPPTIQATPSVPPTIQAAAPLPPTAVAKPVVAAAPASDAPRSDDDKDRRRRRRFGFILFFTALILIFFMVRAIPADWEIGPFRIDASGSAADSAASIYFSDDPHAPFWLLVPTFNLPPRFFAVRPNSSSRPIALAPSSS
jgi:hypothetical protein